MNSKTLFNLKKNLFLITCIFFTCVCANAQKKVAIPRWVTAQPKAGEVVAAGTSIESAKLVGVSALIKQFSQIDADVPCFYNKLTNEHHLFFDPQPSLSRAAANSSFFKVTNKFQPANNDSVWVLVKVLPKDLTAFNDSLHAISLASGADHLIKARELRAEGRIVDAANEYGKAMDIITACLYFPLDTDEGDLAEVIFNEYPTLFDGISFKFDRQSCPMIPGEEIPLDIHLTAYQNGKPLPKFPVKIWMRQNDAKVFADKATDKNGKAKVHIDQAPKNAKTNLLAAVDMDELLQLPENYATPMLKLHLKDSLRQYSMPFVAMDPTPCYYIDVDSIDSVQVCPSLQNLMGANGIGYKEVATAKEADVIISVLYNSEQGVPVKAGNFKIREDKCSVKLTIANADTNSPLLEHSINDFAMSVPETRSAEKVRIRAMSEMIRLLTAEIKPEMSNVQYDKRKKIFNQAK